MALPELEFLTAADACNLLRIARSNFYGRVRDGRLPKPAVRIGRLPRWSRRDLLGAVVINGCHPEEAPVTASGECASTSYRIAHKVARHDR